MRMGSPMLYHGLSVVTCRHPFVGTILRFTGWMGTRGRLAGQSSEVFAGAGTGLCGVKEDCANAATPTADARRITQQDTRYSLKEDIGRIIMNRLKGVQLTR